MDNTLKNKRNIRLDNKNNKVIVFSLILVLVMLLINMANSIYQYFDYESRKESGNDRWKQVENRILDIENEVNSLKGEK